MSEREQAVSAALARRLAEAADGFRSGKPVYLVADRGDPARVQAFEGEGAREAAERARREWEARGDGARPGVFGPYLTEPDPTPGGRAGPEVLEVTVRVRLPDGTTRTETLDGAEVDALFWTRSAVEKFVLPYYAGAQGLERAARVAAEFSGEGVYALAHLPDSIPWALRTEPAGGREPPLPMPRSALRTPGRAGAA